MGVLAVPVSYPHKSLLRPVRWLWHTRFGKNSILSTGAWLVLYGLFYIEVSQLDISSQRAKLIWSFAGAPSGLLIQWLVFGDKLSELWEKMSFKRLAGRLTWRFAAIKLGFFLLNQVAYGALLLKAGLPYLVAAPVAAATISVIYYVVSLFWLMAPAKEVEKAIKA